MNKNRSYNTISFVVFVILLISTFSFFSFADENTNLTLFEDFDKDGLSNTEEKTLGTDPNSKDTDGDGYSDGVEIESGYDPLIPAPNDKIIDDVDVSQNNQLSVPESNVTAKITKDVADFIVDAQENGKDAITPEELNEIVTKAVDEEVEFIDLPTVTTEDIKIKEETYNNLSEKQIDEKKREDAIEYFTTVSYVFISSFPPNFFEQSTDEFVSSMMQKINNYSTTLTDYSYFEEIAESALKAEAQLDDIDVPEDLAEVHLEAIRLLRSMGAIYSAGDYKKANTDIAPVIASLSQMNSLITSLIKFQDLVSQKFEEYEIEDEFLNF
jgi:hypothetical protein